MLKKIDKAVTLFENYFLIIGLLTVSVVLFVNVVLRYVFSAGLSWAEEFSRYVIVWMVTAGVGAAARENMHMSITAIIDLTKSKKFHFGINMFVLLSGLLFAIFTLVTGSRLVYSMILNNQLSPAMEIPLWTIYLALPIGGLLLTYRLVQSFFKQLKAFNALKLGGKK